MHILPERIERAATAVTTVAPYLAEQMRDIQHRAQMTEFFDETDVLTLERIELAQENIHWNSTNSSRPQSH